MQETTKPYSEFKILTGYRNIGGKFEIIGKEGIKQIFIFSLTLYCLSSVFPRILRDNPK